MQQRLTLVTLGVADMDRATRYYERLGWRKSSASQAEVTFFQMPDAETPGMILGLFGRKALAEDAGVPAEGSGFAGIALAQNVGSPEEVDAVLEEMVDAGGSLVKPGQKVFWGGYSGYAADPDGHLWEIAHNPFWPLDEKGRVLLPR